MAAAKILIVEGVRSNDELEEFQKYFRVTVIAIISPPEVRFGRLKTRGRSDDPKNIAEFNERDKQEQSFGISDVIDSADRYILNDDVIETFREEIRIVLKEIAGVE